MDSDQQQYYMNPFLHSDQSQFHLRTSSTKSLSDRINQKFRQFRMNFSEVKQKIESVQIRFHQELSFVKNQLSSHKSKIDQLTNLVEILRNHRNQSRSRDKVSEGFKRRIVERIKKREIKNREASDMAEVDLRTIYRWKRMYA